MNSDQLMKCRDLSSRSSFLSSSSSSAFYSTLLPLQSPMLHGLLGNYANTALASDQDTGGVTRQFLETALITLVHCYQHTECVFLFFYSSVILLLDASNGYAEFDHAWRLILSSGSKLA